jgi:hypothetical protein
MNGLSDGGGLKIRLIGGLTAFYFLIYFQRRAL